MRGNGFKYLTPFTTKPTLKGIEFFNTYIKGSAVTTVPVEQYLKEQEAKKIKNKA